MPSFRDGSGAGGFSSESAISVLLSGVIQYSVVFHILSAASLLVAKAES